uniref:Sulfotransferase n=1 Tax=Electrophorus electricus TaxID=8005 RepID=A0A4W4DQL4_ELEEL
MEGGPLSAEKTLHPFPLLEFQGVPLRSYIVDNWSSISAFYPDPSDLLIATYPKAGTTWAQEMVDLLLHSGDTNICKRAPTNKRISHFYSIDSPGLDLLKSMKPPRVIKTHLPVQLVPKGFWENKCKVRHHRDSLLSL